MTNPPTTPTKISPSASERRSRLLSLLAAAHAPVAGDFLADGLGVSRQAIVHDIGILRAEGQPIVATVRGYLLASSATRLAHRAVVAVRHRPEETETELGALVDVGVRIIDVVVEHPVYGELRAGLHLGSPADVRAWLDATRRQGAHLLSELTDGVHLHTLEAESPERLELARVVLAARGFLLGKR